MIFADKENLKTKVAQELLSVREKEMRFYARNLNMVGTHAALLAGLTRAVAESKGQMRFLLTSRTMLLKDNKEKEKGTPSFSSQDLGPLTKAGALAVLAQVSASGNLSAEEQDAFRSNAMATNAIAGLSGLPQVSLPAAVVGGEGPVGLSLVGWAGGDEALLGLALALERFCRPDLVCP